MAMTQDYFKFLWRHFIIRKPDAKDLKEEQQKDKGENNEEELYKVGIEQFQQDLENMIQD